MWLVLCSAQDVSGLWAFQGLQLRGLRPIELVTTEMLPYSLKWEHTLGASDPSISITLVDGRVIKNGAVRGVLNRLTHVPLQHLAGAPDYDYAMQEYTAFFMSWLFALPQPVLNRADAQGLCGAWRHISEWVWLAGRSGLPTPPYRQTSTDQIDEAVEMRRLHPVGTPTVGAIVVGDRVFGPSFPPEIREACLRLAQPRVVNRAAPMSSNFSKPFQAQLIRRFGFEVPETLITNDPELVKAFRARHQRIIYKSISGVRSIVQTFNDGDMDRLESIRWCPTQFQAFVDGTNVRVHTVGQKVFATAISTDATDYRYAHRQGARTVAAYLAGE